MKLANELTSTDFGVRNVYWWFKASFGGLNLVDQQDWYSELFRTLCESLVDRCDLRAEYDAAETEDEIEQFTLDNLCARCSPVIQHLAWVDTLVAYKSILLQQNQECL